MQLFFMGDRINHFTFLRERPDKENTITRKILYYMQGVPL